MNWKLSMSTGRQCEMNVDCGLIKAKVDGVGNTHFYRVRLDTAFFKKDGVGKNQSQNLKCKDITKKGWNF